MIGTRIGIVVLWLATVQGRCVAAPPNSPPRQVREFSSYYPVRAQTNRVEGAVVVEFDVAESGRVENVAIIEKSGHDLLDLCAAKAVMDSRFKAATENGKRIRQRISKRLTYVAPPESELPALIKKYPKPKIVSFTTKPLVLSQSLKKSGSVDLHLGLDADGFVQFIRVSKSSGDLELDFYAVYTLYTQGRFDEKLPPQRVKSPWLKQVALSIRFKK